MPKNINLDASSFLRRRYFKVVIDIISGAETLKLSQFIHDHQADLFVSHYVPAEMSYLIRLDIPLPTHWFCGFTAWRRLSNSTVRVKASLIEALQALGLAHMAPSVKEELRERIFQYNFDPCNPVDRAEIINYCFSDCDGVAALYNVIADQINDCAMNVWCEYLKAISRMEFRGIPIDYRTASLILRSRWVIADHLIDQVNKTWPVYKDGTFSKKSFLAWCAQQNINWPTVKSDVTGRYYKSFDDDTLKSMEALDPFIANVRQVRKTLNAFKRKSSINIDGHTSKHYFNTSPFTSITSRNQPRNFIFSHLSG